MMHSDYHDYHSGLKISQTDGRLYFHVMFSLLNTFGDIDPHVFSFAGKRCSNTGIGQETAPTSAAKPASQPPAGGILKRNDDKPWDSGVITLFFMNGHPKGGVDILYRYL